MQIGTSILIAIETFLTRIRDFSIRSDYEPHFMGGITRSLIELPLSFGRDHHLNRASRHGLRSERYES